MLAVLIASFTFLAGPFGIDYGYYLHLGTGQWQLIWNQVPIEDVIEDERTDPVVRERLILSQQIRTYAIEELGLQGSDNYTTYCDIGEGPVVWALTAAPIDDLEPYRWSYPVIGSAPYRGFFDRARAEREEAKFRERGYDTYLRGVSAYSTLGWFRDPLLTTMLRYGAIDLADLLIHEMMHATVWIEDDAQFNESLASFVGREGARQWAIDRLPGGRDSLEARAGVRADRKAYRGLLRDLAAALDTIYASDRGREAMLAAKAAAIAHTRERAKTVAWRTDGYQDPDGWTLNNASLSLFRTYHQETDIFDRVLARTGSLVEALKVFETCEGQKDPERHLEYWLEQNATPE